MKYNLNNVVAVRPTKTIYKDDNKIIKLFVENYSKADILNEALIQARVEEGCDLNIPKLIEVTKIDNRWAIVMECIEGKTLKQMLEENPDDEKLLEKFISIQLEVSTKRIALLNDLKEKYKRKINEANIDENSKFELLHRLQSLKSEEQLCHGDFDPSNIILTKDKYYIIDWAHATNGSISADAAMTYLNFSLENKLAERYLNLFSEMSGISKNIIQRWIPIVAATKINKSSSENRKLLYKWIDIVDFQ